MINNKGSNNPFFGKHHTKEVREIISKRFKGKHLSEQHKRHISAGNRGNLKLMQSLKGQRHSIATEFKKGDKLSEEHKKKLLACHLGKHISERHKQILKNARLKTILPVKDTKIEMKIQTFLQQSNIIFLTHRYMRIPHAYQCDIFIPSLNMVIECDGDYWHGNNQMFSDDELTEKIINHRRIDDLRTIELTNKGYKVMRLWEHDIKCMTLEQFKEGVFK